MSIRDTVDLIVHDVDEHRSNSNVSYVRSDSVVHALISGRTSTIFAVPSKQAVYVDTKDEQISENLKVFGKSLVS